MPTPEPARAEQNHSVLATCATDGCINFSRKWRVWYRKVMPGLIALPAMLCDQCHKPVVTTECDQHD